MRFYLFVLLGISSLTAGCSTVAKILERFPPIVERFDASVETSTAPSDVLFSWDVSDPDSDVLSCTLDFGDDSNATIQNCAQVTNTFHTFEQAGNYVAKLTVSDEREATSSTVPVVIKQSGDEAPVNDLISQFVAQPETGTAPHLSIFRWVLKSGGQDVSCSLSFGDGEEEIVENCQDVSDTFHEFTEPGAYRVVLRATTEQTTARKSLIVVVNPAAASP